jgi:hypothetical protein
MSIYQSNIDHDEKAARVKFEYLVKNGKAFELKEKKYTRTLRQNKAMHQYFTMVSVHLNDLDIEFNYEGLVKDVITMPYTPELVKDFFWRPIQIALYGIKSTAKINTEQMNGVIEVISKFFAEKGVHVEFPTKDLMISEELEKEQKSNC